MIVPILSGSGIRIKILEAMANGIAIISTSIGAEGIEVEHDKNIWIADTKEAFAAGLLSLIEDESKRNRIGKNAAEFIKENYAPDKIANKFKEFLSK
jgi:glycosyltransferase involved in cell wall biosynthesis